MSALKYNKAGNLYTGSNVSFDAETKRAYSYSWWIFCMEIDGKVVFNDYNYSSTTIKHQHKVRSVMRDLGIEVDLYVKAPKGLQKLESAIEEHERLIGILQDEISKPKSKKSKNEERQRAIDSHMETIEAIKKLMKVQEKAA